jgi:hypothetical protein
MSENDPPLTRIQLDILELEARTWALNGSKISEFRRRHPNITETAYYVALKLLLTNRTALEYDGGRYAAMLRQIRDRQLDLIERRAGQRLVPQE